MDIIDNDYYYNQYTDLLKKHNGFFNLGIKIPVRDNMALAQVYTPGVASSCLEIQKNLNDAYKETNKLNTMLIVTDSSGFKNYESKNWNNNEPIPFLEAMCVIYKNFANIDCYPIILDHSKITDGKVLAETIQKIMPAYSLVEFFGVDRIRLEEYKEAIGNHKEFATITLPDKRNYEKDLLDLGHKININLVYAAAIRVVLDSQSYVNIDFLIDQLIKAINGNTVKHETHDYFGLLEGLVNEAAKIVMSNGLSTQKTKDVNLNRQELSVDYINNKFKRFVNEGEKAWIDAFPDNFYTKHGTNNENSLLFHYRYKGFVGTNSTLHFRNPVSMFKLLAWNHLERLSDVFHKDPEQAIVYSCKNNLGAIITNGTAILGLGDIGALPGLPVMEGKSILFKLFGGTNIIPICVNEKDPKKLIELVERMSPIFSAINLEDIKAPECFEVEQTLIERTNFPVFHDDQHGTAIVVLAGLINAIKLAEKSPDTVKVVMNGAGAAGLSVTQLLIHHGFKNFIICDTNGAIYTGRPKGMNPFKDELAKMTNLDKKIGTLEEIIKGADVFVGLSAAGALKPEWVKTMGDKPIIFALANPTPEIMPDLAKEAGAFIIATGRSDFRNQINNSLAFPGIFRAAIDTRSSRITVEMKEAAAIAISQLVKPEDLTPDHIIPQGLDPKVPEAVTFSVAKVAIETGYARDKIITPDKALENIMIWNLEDHILNWPEIEEFKLKWDLKMK